MKLEDMPKWYQDAVKKHEAELVAKPLPAGIRFAGEKHDAADIDARYRAHMESLRKKKRGKPA